MYLDCPDGSRCDCTIASHYRKYRHIQLANHRAGVGTVPQRSEQSEFSYGIIVKALNSYRSINDRKVHCVTNNNYVSDATACSSVQESQLLLCMQIIF